MVMSARPRLQQNKKGRLRRGLTAAEISGLRPLFGEVLGYGDVRVHRGAGLNPLAMIAFINGNPAIALGRHIHIAAALYRDDYAPDREAFGHFIVHEAVHVWQWASGRFNPLVYLWQYNTRPGHGYDIAAVTAESRFDGLGYDQQAEVARHYFIGECNGDPARRARAAQLRPVLVQALPLAGRRDASFV